MIDRSHPMVSSDKKLANAVGGKTARACDNCIRKRARWYCAADDAFLCQSCDASVHSANPLARRHERVRLKVASLKLISSLDDKPAVPPPWHQGFTKKPRTPRGGKLHASRHTPKSEESSMITFNPLHLVPEMGSDETTPVTSCHEEQLLYQVPVFDPFAAELCLSNEVAMPVKVRTPVDQPKARMVDLNNNNNNNNNNINNNSSSLNGGLIILPSDVELAEFTADVESLLGKGLDEESFAMEGLGLGLGLGLLDYPQKDYSVDRVKVEEDDHDQLMQQQQKQSDHHHHHHHQLMVDRPCEMEMMRDEPFQLSFDYDDSPLWEEKEDKVPVGSGDYIMKAVDHDHHVNINDDTNYVHNNVNYDDENKKISKRILLKLDYEGIIAAWDEQRSPWTTGDRPELDPDDCNWPHCMGGIMHYNNPCGDMVMMTGNPAMLDGGREARVSRYREKRRTRLFSKKIRYEVRKLNAEKRPRMKGRFVKRASSSGFPLLSK